MITSKNDNDYVDVKFENIKNIPNHIAIICDGNRRWAKQNGKLLNLGHKAGADNIENLCKYCIKYGVKYLTLYCLSIENLNRSATELEFLFRCFNSYLSQKNLDKAKQEGIDIKIIGNDEVLPKDLVQTINNVNGQKLDKNNTKLHLSLCIGYSGRDEIINLAKNISYEVKNNNLNIEDVNEEICEKYLYSKVIPDVDLMIRTGGDIRISNFLLWKISYAELYFCQKYFPDFDEQEFLLALYSFNSRIRRYGR